MVRLSSGEALDYATSGGFVEVLNNTVTVLAETAELATEIDIERARDAEARALERLASAVPDIDKQRAAAALERARNRLRAAMGAVGTRI